MTRPVNNPVEAWLRRLHWALQPMPSPARDEILAETRAHLTERLEGGADPFELLESFGPPDAYARHFLDEMELAHALGEQKSADLLAVIGRRVHRSLIAAFAFAVVVALAGLSLAALATLFYEITDPVHSGLWRGSNQFFIGVIDDPGSARDLLGPLIWPAAIAVIALSWVLGRTVLLAAARCLARTR
jgi:uncharacterized membrane protein